MRLIATHDDIAEGLQALVGLDPRLGRVIEIAGEVPLRLREPGFEGLARIVVSQQLSVASAQAIWGRFCTTVDPDDADAVMACEEERLRAAGLSAAKVRTLRAMGEAVCCGDIDLVGMGAMPAGEAHAALVTIKGIGPWTADVFLMFCLAHADAFAPGDLALQQAACEAFELEERPSAKALSHMAESWRPWRAVAARLLWAYYRARRQGRESLPV